MIQRFRSYAACLTALALVVGLAAAPAARAEGLDGVRVSPATSSAVAISPVLLAPAGQRGLATKSQAQVAARGASLETALVERDHTCGIQSISCGQTVNSNLTTHDCEDTSDPGFYYDFWEFNGTAGSTVTVNLRSSDFDTLAGLANPDVEVVAVDDDGGNGTNSRIIWTLGQSGLWTIIATNLFADDLGSYTVSLACSGMTGGGNDDPPAAPTELMAAPISTSEIQLSFIDNADNETQYAVEVRELGGNFQEIGTVGANVTMITVSGLDEATTYEFRVRARNAAGNSDYSNIAMATTNTVPFVCAEDNFTLCLNDNRFEVTMDFDTPQDPPARAQALTLPSDFSGLFYFRNANNAEVLIKVLDGCTQNGFYWVFYAATTNVAFEIRVTDTETGQIKVYTNPLRNPAPPVQDTLAFGACM